MLPDLRFVFVAVFCSVVLLFGENISTAFSAGGNKAELGGLALLCVGSIAWSGGSLYSKYNSHGGSAAVSTAWQMIAAGIVYGGYAIALGLRELGRLAWKWNAPLRTLKRP